MCRSPAQRQQAQRCSATRWTPSPPGRPLWCSTSKVGKLRVHANWGPERHPALPYVPTLRELGVATECAQWSGLFVPTGTPGPVLNVLRKAARELQDDAAFKLAFVTLQTPLAYLDAPAFRLYWDADAKKMADVVQRIGKLDQGA